MADHFDTGLEISPCLRMLFACRAMTNARSARFDFSRSSVERGIRSAWYAGHRLERTALGVDRETMSGVLPDIPHRTAEQVRQPPNRPPCSAMTVTSTSVLPHSRRRGAFTIVQKVSSHTTDSAMPPLARQNFGRCEAHSPAERDHVSFVEERLHPFVSDCPLEFGVGIFVACNEFVPNYGRGGGIDHLERPFGFVLKPDDRDRYRDAVLLHGPSKPDWTMGFRSIIAASKFEAVLLDGAGAF